MAKFFNFLFKNKKDEKVKDPEELKRLEKAKKEVEIKVKELINLSEDKKKERT